MPQDKIWLLEANDCISSAKEKLAAFIAHVMKIDVADGTAHLSSENHIRGRPPADWHEPVFSDAMRRFQAVGSYRKALDTAISHYLKNHPDQITTDVKSCIRTFRLWRDAKKRGADWTRSYDVNSFNISILQGDSLAASKVFVSLSLATRKNIAQDINRRSNFYNRDE